MNNFDYVVVGGGIAGISAIQQIYLHSPESSILLLTVSSYVKVATTRLKLTSHIEELDIQEKTLEELHHSYPNLLVASSKLDVILPTSHIIKTSSGQKYCYKKLCLCTGSIPKLVEFENKNIIGLRDTDSAVELKQKLSHSKRVCIIGNGGIATELIHELKNVHIIWVVRNKYVASTFVDSGAAEFLVNCEKENEEEEKPFKTWRYTITSGNMGEGSRKSDQPGCALGPNWHDNLDLKGTSSDKKITIEYESEVESISESKPASVADNDSWPVYVKLQNGKEFGCDLIVSATGVSPAVPPLGEDQVFLVAQDGGVLVNQSMETNIPDIYAAGDVCTVNWDVARHWFQMRLWTQARPMGGYAGQCMVSSLKKEPPPLLDFSFELFTHVTRFFGYRVVLLGLFNGQKLNGQYEALIRVTKGLEYIKLIVSEGKLQGAVLIGETEMEETIENLILNQLDVSRYGENLLNPDIDIDDYFD